MAIINDIISLLLVTPQNWSILTDTLLGIQQTQSALLQSQSAILEAQEKFLHKLSESLAHPPPLPPSPPLHHPPTHLPPPSISIPPPDLSDNDIVSLFSEPPPSTRLSTPLFSPSPPPLTPALPPLNPTRLSENFPFPPHPPKHHQYHYRPYEYTSRGPPPPLTAYDQSAPLSYSNSDQPQPGPSRVPLPLSYSNPDQPGPSRAPRPLGVSYGNPDQPGPSHVPLPPAVSYSNPGPSDAALAQPLPFSPSQTIADIVSPYYKEVNAGRMAVKLVVHYFFGTNEMMRRTQATLDQCKMKRLKAIVCNKFAS